jgi:heme-degrading monooxygenase HmoA
VKDRTPDFVEDHRQPVDLHRLELKVTSVTPSFTLARPEVHMYARVWKFVILPGKVEEFAAAAKFAIPILRGQPGFRSFTVLRSGPGERLEATVVSAWDTLVALRNSETSAFQQALARALTVCEPRPFMREEEVLVSEFASDNSDDNITQY